MPKDQALKGGKIKKAKETKQLPQKNNFQKRLNPINLAIDSKAPIYSAVPGRKYSDLE
jgi:hypothetical protein